MGYLGQLVVTNSLRVPSNTETHTNEPLMAANINEHKELCCSAFLNYQAILQQTVFPKPSETMHTYYTRHPCLPLEQHISALDLVSCQRRSLQAGHQQTAAYSAAAAAAGCVCSSQVLLLPTVAIQRCDKY
jgi:hypothetical protein